jgi:tagatose-6-phosphate ketose/aldose isomerase
MSNVEKFLGIDSSALEQKSGLLTAREIVQQPKIWGTVQALLEKSNNEIVAFLEPLIMDKNARIILTGAGTSSFIGECLAPLMLNNLSQRVEAISTTNLVSGPQHYFQKDVPTLLVSFARSGNSPESVAAVDLAYQCIDNIYHLIITCNEDGQLYKQSIGQKKSKVLLLPNETHDRGFAMTSSFTSMLLSAASIFGVIDSSAKSIAAISNSTAELINDALPVLNNLVSRKFERVVYLGSNELKGLAQEAALKLLELSDGRVVGLFDSPLGFRHGPKTVVNEKTLIVLFVSNDPYTRQYDLDLLRELRADNRAGQVLVLSAKDDIANTAQDNSNIYVRGLATKNDLELALPYVVFAQIFAFLQSLSLGITPDTPSMSGTVNRVVKGVTIYPFDNKISGKE